MPFYSSIRIFILVQLMLWICGNTLQAQISASDTEGCAPLVGVQFSHAFAGATGINWNFDDGASSNLGSPFHTFATPGVYTVTFTATVGGNPVNEQIDIEVFGNPEPEFAITSPVSGCAGLNVSFEDLSTGGGGVPITGWNWAFGDGGTNTSTGDPTYTFNLAGTFDVSLIVTDANGCVNSYTINNAITISDPPTISITTNPTPAAVCDPPLTVTFNSTASSNSPLGNSLTYEWDFDNGTSSSQADPPAVTYTESGVFFVELTVTDDNNCSGIETIPVSIANPIASFTAVGAENDTVCKEVVFINNSTGVSPLYTYGDGTTGIQPFHTYPSAGWYDVTLEVESGACSDDTTISIYVQVPTVNINLNVDTICQFPGIYNLSATTNVPVDIYDWTLPGQDESALPSLTDTVYYPVTEYTINVAVDEDIQLTITSTDGCTATDTDSFVLVRPNALFYPDEDEGCAPLAVTFTDYSSTEVPVINQWKWNFGDGSPVLTTTTNADVTHTYTEPGIYNPFLIVVTNGGCRDTSWLQTIEVGEAPTPSFTIEPTVVCIGEDIQITDTSSPADSIDTWHYDGDSGLMFSCQTDPNPVVNFEHTTGELQITMTAGYNGCYSSVTQSITVNGPLAKLSHSCNCESPMDYPFTADVSDADYWTWDFGDGEIVSNSTATNILHSYAGSGDYYAVLTAFNEASGCPAYTDTMLIRARDVEAIFALEDSVCAGENIVFSGLTSVDVAANDGVCYNSYSWFFGDNTPPKTSNGIYEHAFDASGDIVVELYVEDINGCVDSASQHVFVSAVDGVISFTQDGPCLPMEVNFESTVTSDLPITSYAWNFGDGGTSSVADPDYTYLEEILDEDGDVAEYYISFQAINSLGCAWQDTLEILPNVPDATFEAITPVAICVDGSVTFDPTLPQTGNLFLWSFGDGDGSNVYNPEHTYGTAGDYDVSLTVTNQLGCSNTEILEDYIDVQAFPQAGFTSTLEDGQTICYPAQITFTDTSLVNPFGERTWDLGNGAPAIGTQTIGANYNAPGEYTIDLIVETSAGCADSASLTIEVEGPVGNFTLQPFTICRGETITLEITDTVDVMTWQWDFGDGNVEGPLAEVEHSYDFDFYPSSGETVVSLIMWNQDSICSVVESEVVDFVDVIADFIRNDELVPQDTAHCVGIMDIFSNLSSDNVDDWYWHFGDGQSYIGENPPPILYAPGTYEVSLSVIAEPEGCVDTMSKIMIVHPLPDAQAFGGAICLGENFQLDASGGESYEWSPEELVSESDIQSPLAFPDITTEFTVTVTDTNGCVNDASTFVTVFQPLEPVDVQQTLIIGETYELDLPYGNGYTYEWISDIWISCTDCSNPVFQPLQDTVYYVTIADTLGCFSAVSRYEFIVLPLASLDVPDAFTPNGDNVNDVVYVKGWGIEKLLEFKIFNRWGELVFETTNLEEGWDGTYKGKEQMADTYSYYVSVKPYIQDVPLTKQGFINIIR